MAGLTTPIVELATETTRGSLALGVTRSARRAMLDRC
jgi:hypothetical protein